MQPQYSQQQVPQFSPYLGQVASQAQIPPAVFQAAEVAGLGMPTREYNRGARSSSALGLILPISLTIVLLVVIAVPVVNFLVFAPLNASSPSSFDLAFNLVPLIVPLIVILFVGPLAFRSWKGVLGGGKAGGFRAWSCANGLVYEQGGRLQTVRWVDIAQIWRKVGVVNGVPTTIGYEVQPSRAEPFSFSLLSGSLAALASSVGPGGSVSVSGVGTISSSGDTLQIAGNVGLSAYEGLGDVIEDQMAQSQLPLALNAYRGGTPLTFGRLTVQQQGLSDGVKTLTWDEFDHLLGNVAILQFTKKPTSLPWFTLSASDTPNMALLATLIKAIRGSQT